MATATMLHLPKLLILCDDPDLEHSFKLQAQASPH